MNLAALVLGLFSGLRPGTSLAAVLALLKTPPPQRPLLAFTAAGFASTWLIGLVVVGAFHGADVAGRRILVHGRPRHRSRLGGARVRGRPATRARSSPPRWEGRGGRRLGPPSRFARGLRNPSARVAAVAGIGTHLPGLIYLAALNAIASERPAPVDVDAAVAIYDALWFLVPTRRSSWWWCAPARPSAYIDAATVWVRSHEHAVLVTGSFVLGGYLVVKGAASLLT